MTSTAKSILYYSIYMMGMGLGLLFIPDLILGVFGFDPTNDIWIRILGLFAFCASMLYFLLRAYTSNRVLSYFRYGTDRLLFGDGENRPVPGANTRLALISSVDLFGAIWTVLTLRKEH